MVAYADAKGYSRASGDYKSLNLPFHHRIMSMHEEYRRRIIDETEQWALRFFEAFGSIGTGTATIEAIIERNDHNSAPARRISADRKAFTAGSAPDARSSGPADGRDYSD
jgi:hypothetical protein